MELLTKHYQRPTPPTSGIHSPSALIGLYRSGLARLGKSQWWSSRQLRDYQFHLLGPMLVHAYETIPYYRKTFDERGLRPEDISPDTWHEVPILTRNTLQVESLLSQRIPDKHGRHYVTETSGSTGQPVKVNCTGYSQFFFEMMGLRDHLWHQRDLTQRHVSIRHFPSKVIPPQGLSSPNWGDIAEQLLAKGPSAILSIRNTVDQQLHWLRGQNPTYLLTYPSNLKALIERSREVGIALPALREVRTISETVAPELYDLCQSTWGAKLVDTYSSQEFGYLALQCPEHRHYHVQSEGVLLEVLDDDGRPCRPGEIGRVVITSLRNYAMPLIRYQIRDYAEVGVDCPCGRGLPVINRIVGRQRNMLSMPSGEQRWPVFSWLSFPEVAPVRQFQFIQHSLELIEMRLVTEHPLDDIQRQRLTEIIRESLGYPFTIIMTPMDDIPQGVNGKFEEFVSHVSGLPQDTVADTILTFPAEA